MEEKAIDVDTKKKRQNDRVEILVWKQLEGEVLCDSWKSEKL
jgi:hypothetical protein